jgi:hypothetical protein
MNITTYPTSGAGVAGVIILKYQAGGPASGVSMGSANMMMV